MEPTKTLADDLIDAYLTLCVDAGLRAAQLHGLRSRITSYFEEVGHEQGAAKQARTLLSVMLDVPVQPIDSADPSRLLTRVPELEEVLMLIARQARADRQGRVFSPSTVRPVRTSVNAYLLTSQSSLKSDSTRASLSAETQSPDGHLLRRHHLRHQASQAANV